MKRTYTFSILRFVYDPLTLEFVNVGVVLYSPQDNYLRAYCTSHYTRISKLFCRIDGARLRQTLHFIQDRINAIGDEFSKGLIFGRSENIEDILAEVLPVDDSSLRFVTGGTGLMENAQVAMDNLVMRYVERYSTPNELPTRNEEDVWRTFKEPLQRRQVVARFTQKRIFGSNFDYEFQRSWKNGLWNLYEPVSFDLMDVSSILDKANRWVGRATALQDSSEPFKLYMLLGAPKDHRLIESYRRAENILNMMPVEHEVVEEKDAEAFAEELQYEIQRHTG